MNRFQPVIFILIFLHSALLFGQPKKDKREVINSLTIGSRIKLEMRNSDTIEGRLVMRTTDTLYMDFGEPTGQTDETKYPVSKIEKNIPVDSIEKIWVQGTASKTGAIIGTIAGGLSMAAFGIGLVASLCSDGGIYGDCSNEGGTIAIFTIGGLVGGALTGAAIGAAIPRWHRRFP